ncbi:MAG: CinA family nicotinamide mononucleotide deamidase-related protein [Planctomycetes bacterium]|nr:CinA family nicotinamide mononucleotide deamidase-related protein [Planctomycetota bacterium]MCB9911030.1 CinA family nicotinamide mononucleotide deamidase-related protein [Planctomycetota bacterium]HPF14434.1 CinA family nicotinamide mononucleotide deamidase-related protein [Planctomycetota bacterium]
MPPKAEQPPARTAFLFGLGDELLRGDHADLNSPYLARILREFGYQVVETRVLPDDQPAMVRALREASQRASLVLTTGGLGPTADDLTRHAAAEAAGVPIEFDEATWQWVLAWYLDSKRVPPESNRRQALLPRGGIALHNVAGTAPGLRLALGSATLFCLPGPPREVEPMVERELIPWLRAQAPDEECRHTLRVFLASLSESQFADEAGPLLDRHDDALVGVTAKAGRLAVTITTLDRTPQAAQHRAEALQAQFVERFGASVYSLDEPDLEQVLGRELIARGVRVTAAESCTLGMVAAALGAVPGISAVLDETYGTYSNAAKTRTLGVPSAVLERFGAVSEPVARAMALGALERSGADLAVSVTGVAGPDGGTPEKPVGLVWFAVAWRGKVLLAESRQFPPASRERVRTWASNWALHALLRVLRSV